MCVQLVDKRSAQTTCQARCSTWLLGQIGRSTAIWFSHSLMPAQVQLVQVQLVHLVSWSSHTLQMLVQVHQFHNKESPSKPPDQLWKSKLSQSICKTMSCTLGRLMPRWSPLVRGGVQQSGGRAQQCRAVSSQEVFDRSHPTMIMALKKIFSEFVAKLSVQLKMVDL